MGEAPVGLAALASLGALVTPEGLVLAAPLVGAGAVTDAPALGDAAASLGAVVVTPVLGAGAVTVAPVLGVAAFVEGLGGVALLVGAAFVMDVFAAVSAIAPFDVLVVLFAAAVSAIAPFEVLVVVPVLDFFEVSLGVVCCAAAGIDSAVSRTAASAYRCAMMVSPARCCGICRLFSTDSLSVTAQTMHTALRNVNFSGEKHGQ